MESISPEGAKPSCIDAFMSEKVRWRGHLVERQTAMKLAAELDQDWHAVLLWFQCPAAADDFDLADVLPLHQAFELTVQDSVIPFNPRTVPP